MKNAVLGMDDRTVELQQEFNALVSQYQQIYGGALVELDGKQLTIPQLGPYKEDLNPAVRRAAYEAEAGYFDAHRDELDTLYTKIVKNLNQQAKVLGYKDYSELSYVRMNRIGYGQAEIQAFRDQVAQDVVPELQKVMAMRAKRTGITHPTFTDLPIIFKDGNPKPIPGYQARMDAARTMYHELSPETAEFIDFMQDNELFDVESRPGKMSGGYMTSLPSYKAPFIFANWNNTSGDVDVLTHECGHAFEAMWPSATQRACRSGMPRHGERRDPLHGDGVPHRAVAPPAVRQGYREVRPAPRRGQLCVPCLRLRRGRVPAHHVPEPRPDPRPAQRRVAQAGKEVPSVDRF